MKKEKGQIFITLLFFVIIGITIILAEVLVVFSNIQSAGIQDQGTNAYYIAESGIEEALLRLTRDKNYSGGTLSVGSGNATMQVQNNIITSIGVYGGTTKKIQVVLNQQNGSFSIVSWEEI